MSVRRENLQVFADELDAYLRATYADDVFVPQWSADIRYDKVAMQAPFFADLARLEPFGEGNPTPKFVVSSADCRFTRIGETEHIKCKMSADVEVVDFGGLYLLTAVKTGASFDYYCDASKRVFQNRAYIQLSVTDVVAVGCEQLRDSAPAFGNYLKTVLYPPKEVGTRTSDLKREIADLEGSHGVLFVAFGAKSAQDFMRDLTLAGKRALLGRIAVGRTDLNPLHTLLIAPTDTTGWQYYSSIVFLDAPLSLGYLAWVGSRAPNPELVLLRRYAFLDRIARLHIDKADVDATLRAIRRVEPSKYHSLEEMCVEVQACGHDIADVYAHFYILYELGVIAVGPSFRLQFREATYDLNASRVYKNISKLRTTV